MPAGRPRKEIKQETFEKLCAMFCTKDEIAGFFECSPDTIENWCHATYDANFSAIYEQKKQGGKISLRRAQLRLAEKSAAMAIFLGKNYLGQVDTPESADGETLAKLDEVLKTIKGVE
jgi:hypothetical protein